MKTLVVYDSVYGNTEIVARAIGDAIPGEVQVQRVAQVNVGDLETVDLLIIGSPTHGAMPTEAVQSLVGRIGSSTREDAKAATFDTRLTWKFLERWGGFAAPKMADSLREKGWTVVGEPGGFFVKGLKKGPLKRGEVDRAGAWATGLVSLV
ncbi:MAG TPA: flavodoxin domain-containing protein [Anaerolineae bacterium]|nr:flavodoxin domain-containing protein [Anaerolineae bacterium]